MHDFTLGYILPLMSIITVVSLVLLSMPSNLFLKYRFIVLSHEAPPILPSLNERLSKMNN